MKKVHGFLLATFSAVVLSKVAFAEGEAPAAVRELEVVVDGGYKPARLKIQEGEPVRLKFVKKDYSGCTKEVVFPTLNIKRELKPNIPAFIDLAGQKAGELPFQCGMGMQKGAITVEPKKS